MKNVKEKNANKYELIFDFYVKGKDIILKDKVIDEFKELGLDIKENHEFGKAKESLKTIYSFTILFYHSKDYKDKLEMYKDEDVIVFYLDEILEKEVFSKLYVIKDQLIELKNKYELCYKLNVILFAISNLKKEKPFEIFINTLAKEAIKFLADIEASSSCSVINKRSFNG